MRWRRRLGHDVLAGVSVAAIGIPQSLAYADLAGMPPIVGLYAGALPPLVAALFASSPYLQTGPVAITALLTFGALSTQATPGSPEYVALGFALALIVGVVRVALGLLRSGWLAYLMSQPMLLGFVPAAALLIAASQLSKLAGMPPAEPGNAVVEAWSVLGSIGEWSIAALIVTAATVVVIVLGRCVHRLFPGVLLAVVLGVVVSALGWYPGPVVGTIPAGFVPFTLDDLPWSRVGDLLLPGAVIALIGFSEAASIARRFATADRSRWNADREFVSQGMANLTAAACGGMPCGGSFSRSAVNRISGARTRWSGAFTGLTVLAFLPLVAVLEPLPLAVLGAIVVVAVAELVRLEPLARLWTLSLPQAIVAWSTFAATLLLSPRLDLAVLFGVVLSVLVFLWRSMQIEVDRHADGKHLTLSPRGVLWFGTAQRLQDELLDVLAAHTDADAVTLELSRLGRIDTTGALALREVLVQARDAGLDVEVHGIPPQSALLTARVLDMREPGIE